jgi:hypothetical protein
VKYSAAPKTAHKVPAAHCASVQPGSICFGCFAQLAATLVHMMQFGFVESHRAEWSTRSEHKFSASLFIFVSNPFVVRLFGCV